MIEALCFHIWVWLAGDVRATHNLYGDDIPGRGSSGADCGEATATDDGAKNIASCGLTLIIREDDRGINDWTEGGKEEGGGRGGNLAREGRG